MSETMVRILVAKAPDECPICHTKTMDLELSARRFQRQGVEFSASGLACRECDIPIYIVPKHIKDQLTKIRGEADE